MLRLSIIFFSSFLCLAAKNKSADDRPNIVIFFTDDQGYSDLGCFGAEGFETPHLDKLASEGMRFTNFYVPATVCTPSRASLLTGRYAKRLGLHEAVLFPYSKTGLATSEYTLAELLKDNGYRTSCIGKWHLGHKEEFMPNNQGFDSFYGVPYSNDMDNHFYEQQSFQAPPLPLYRDLVLEESGSDQALLTKKYTEEATSQIKNRRDKPFFMYLAHNMPHEPLYASPKFKGKSEKGIYGDVIMELDWSAGEIIKALKAEGIYENTIFIFTSDNGPQIGSAKPLRGQKAQTWEGGQRVPAIITWPLGIPKGKVSNEMLSTLDLFPTLARITNSKLPKDIILDGMDVSSFLTDPEIKNLPERPFFFYARNGKPEAIRLGKWKLHLAKSRGWDEKSNGTFPVSLYNLEVDMAEENNLANKFPEIVTKLKNMLNAFDESLAN